MIMEKSIYYSPKVKEINLSIRRCVCLNGSDPDGLNDLSSSELSDDFS